VPTSQIAQEVAAGAGISLGQAARRLPSYRESRPVSPSTLWRWISRGVLLADGSHVRLEAVRLGGRWLTSIPALERFTQAQTPAVEAGPAPTPNTPRTLAQRARAAERAAAELEKLGL